MHIKHLNRRDTGIGLVAAQLEPETQREAKI